MKRNFAKIILVLLLVFTLGGCELTGDKTNNEIITRRYVDVENITIVDFQNLIEEVITKVERSVIGVTHKNNNNPISVGSGVVYRQQVVLKDPSKGEEAEGNIDYYVYRAVTNRHVIQDDRNRTFQVYAYMGYDDEEVKATVIGMDPKVDIAVIEFKYSKHIMPIKFAEIDSADPSKQIKKGSFGIAIGNPDGYKYFGSATLGIISAPIRYMEDDSNGDGIVDFYGEYIQHDVAINPGNSGGGLFNIKGELIGINTLKLVSNNIEGMGFAIPADIVAKIVFEYIETGQQIVRPKLGVTGIEVKSITPAVSEANNLKPIPEGINYGIYVTDLVQGGSVYGSGVEKDDIILTFDGMPIKYTYELMAIMSNLVDYSVGDVVEITYYSRATGQIKTGEITLKASE